MSSYRSFEVVRKVRENGSVVSLYLKPTDDAPLKQFKPGQHLMFKFRIPGCEIPVFRYYSFSDKFRTDCYRVSVKKELPPAQHPCVPPGLCSSYICDDIREGTILEAKGPSGEFYLTPEEDSPVVLIAGGIGVTPLLSMIKSIAEINPKRKVDFFYGVNGKHDHSFQSEMDDLRKTNSAFSISTFYADVRNGGVKGLDYDYEGFIDMATVVSKVSSPNADYFVCGPAAMMKYVSGSLETFGVPKEKIRTESFSQSYETVLNAELSEVAIDENENRVKHNGLVIEFTKSNKRLLWDSRYKSILEFAEANDIEISSGCLFGDCGSCLTNLREGKVKYIHATAIEPGSGECLPCSSIPLENLALEA